jgi:hypothetical protein
MNPAIIMLGMAWHGMAWHGMATATRLLHIPHPEEQGHEGNPNERKNQETQTSTLKDGWS